MRMCAKAFFLAIIAALWGQGGPAAAAPPAPRALAISAPGLVQAVGHRTHHHAHRRVHRHHGKYRRHRAHGHRYHHRHGYRHRKCRSGWLPPLKEHRHLPGCWKHCHTGNWHRSHYYFYGYQQWARWNPDKSRAYFRRHYHH